VGTSGLTDQELDDVLALQRLLTVPEKGKG